MGNSRPGVGVTVALVGLVVVDALLVGAALRPRSAPTDLAVTVADARSGVPASPTATSDPPSATPSGTAFATSTASGGPAGVVPLTRLLSVVGTDVAWRGTAGSCGRGGSVLQRTDDGGSTWQDVDSPLGSLVRVRAKGRRAAFVVGGTRDCTPELRSTTDAASWQRSSSELRAAWYRDPGDVHVVHGPGAREARPCGRTDVVDLLPGAAARATALCADGRVQRSTDDGETWRTAGSVTGAVAVAGADTPLLAVPGADDCDGVAVVSLGDGGPEQVGCVGAATHEAGRTALATSGQDAWLVAGDATYRSGDGGRTWTAVR